MILDKVLHGVLDQQRGILLVYDEPAPDVSSIAFGFPSMPIDACAQNTYSAAIETLEQVGKVVDSLYAKVRRLTFVCVAGG